MPKKIHKFHQKTSKKQKNKTSFLVFLLCLCKLKNIKNKLIKNRRGKIPFKPLSVLLNRVNKCFLPELNVDSFLF